MTSKNSPVELLKSGQILAVTDSPMSGIILQKPYFAEFVGPGAAVGGMFDLECVTIHTLGATELTTPASKEERQTAFARRMEDIQNMQNMCQEAPLRRAINLLEMLCGQYGLEEIRKVPNDVLAKIVGVLPGTIAMAWQSQYNLSGPTDNVESAAALTLDLAA
jgi:hypothetical protein